MAECVFVRRDGNHFSQLRTRSFSNENELDELMNVNPEFLAAALSSDDRRLRFVLIDSQARLDDVESGRSGRWSADLIYLDNEGVVTIVEDKLARNSEIRRKVLGQAIEYAAIVANTFSVDGIMERFSDMVDDPDEAIQELVGPEDGATTDFWKRVEDKLQAGALRIVFASDELPSELRMTIEFLNRVTHPMEVIGLQLRQLELSDNDQPQALIVSAVGINERKSSKSRISGTRQRTPIEAYEFLCELGKVGVGSQTQTLAAACFDALINRSDIYRGIFYRTTKGYPVARFTRITDERDIISFQLNKSGDGWIISAPANRQNWPDDLRESFFTSTGHELEHGKLGSLNEWLTKDPDHARRLMEWLLNIAPRYG